MTSGTPDAERLAALKKRRDEFIRYLSLFEAAFDELHDAVVTQVNTPGQYISPHHDYPVRSLLDSGFPSFHESGFYRDDTPRDYVGTMRPRGLVGLLGEYKRPAMGFPKGAELASFLRNHDIGKRLNLGEPIYDGTLSEPESERSLGFIVLRAAA